MRISDWSSDVYSSDLSGTTVAATTASATAGTATPAARRRLRRRRRATTESHTWPWSMPPGLVSRSRLLRIWWSRSDTVDLLLVCGGQERCLERVPSAMEVDLRRPRSEEHTSELQSLMRTSY